MILVVGRVRCAAERRDELVALFERMQDASWADREALDRHFATPHLQEFARGLREVVSERPEVAIHEVAATSGFPG